MREVMFMRRLKRMIEKYEQGKIEVAFTSLSLYCPILNNYDASQDVVVVFNKFKENQDEVCDFCRKVVGAKKCCPCREFTERNAHIKARRAIIDYEMKTGLVL